MNTLTKWFNDYRALTGCDIKTAKAAWDNLPKDNHHKMQWAKESAIRGHSMDMYRLICDALDKRIDEKWIADARKIINGIDEELT